MSASERKLSLREIYRWPFWLLYFIVLIAALPLPFLEQQMSLTMEGQVMQEEARTVPLWECYAETFKGHFWRWYFAAIAIHIGGVFAVMAAVWYIVLGRGAVESESDEEPQPSDRGGAGEDV